MMLRQLFQILSRSVLIAVLLPAPLWAENVDIPQITIGIEKHRAPYTYLDKQQKTQGILVDMLTDLCKEIPVKCQFSVDHFDTLVEKTQTYQLQGFVVIDTFIYTEFDDLKLTAPLCTLQPILVQLATEKPKLTPDDFKNTTIGTRTSSLFHLYLLEQYSSVARLKTYQLSEEGIFDLTSKRINILFVDDAFFNQQVKNTVLGTTNSASKLVAYPAKDVELPATSMRLALRGNDTALLNKFNKLLQDKPPPNCADLLKPPMMPTPSQPAAQQ